MESKSMERVFHTWDKWECYPAGFYENHPPAGMTAGQAVEAYTEFLRDTPRFRAALQRVICEWVNSCEHYLTNENMNRIAWLGQAAMCITTGVPSAFRGGFNRLTDAEQEQANLVALEALNDWLASRGEPPAPDLESVKSKTEANLY